MKTNRMSRRDFLKIAGFSSAAIFLNKPANLFGLPAMIQPQMEEFMPDAEISITAKPKLVQILSGAQTQTWSYEGQLLSGSGVTVQAVPGSYLGPILRAKTGTKVRIYFHNQLGEDSVVHPHGLRVPEDCDGQPMQAIASGQTKIYDFQVIDRAGPYWFHPHPMGRTAEQVAMGLAGLFYVWDDEEVLAVPGAATGANDMPVILQDRNFDSGNQILYNPNMMWGYLGSRILVNGKPNATSALEPRAYRLRIINGSNARTYEMTLVDPISNNPGPAIWVIGTDGGYLDKPAGVGVAGKNNKLAIMSGERYTAIIDFEGHREGKPIDGANDGASGVGVLLEIARQLSITPPPVGVDIILFDAEDYGPPQDETVSGDTQDDWGLGAQYWSNQPHKANYYASYGILLDMVGAANATFLMEGYSVDYASGVLQRVWDIGNRAGYGAYFRYDRGGYITDDHLPVNKIRQIPMIDLIHLDRDSDTGFYPYWHTTGDNLSQIDKTTLEVVGKTLMAVIFNP